MSWKVLSSGWFPAQYSCVDLTRAIQKDPCSVLHHQLFIHDCSWCVAVRKQRSWLSSSAMKWNSLRFYWIVIFCSVCIPADFLVKVTNWNRAVNSLGFPGCMPWTGDKAFPKRVNPCSAQRHVSCRLAIVQTNSSSLLRNLGHLLLCNFAVLQKEERKLWLRLNTDWETGKRWCNRLETKETKDPSV